MLSGATEFPQAGSYALLLSPAPPVQRRQAGDPQQEETQGPQLVRIIRLLPPGTPPSGQPAAPGGWRALVSLPLVADAGGTRTVDFAELVDGTPLASDESREMTDLQRELARSRVRGRRAKQLRFEALRSRAVWAPLLKVKLQQHQRLLAKREAA